MIPITVKSQIFGTLNNNNHLPSLPDHSQSDKKQGILLRWPKNLGGSGVQSPKAAEFLQF